MPVDVKNRTVSPRTPQSAIVAVDPLAGSEYVAARPKGQRARQAKDIAWGLAFLGPNILGFLSFTVIPLVFSVILAFTDWNLRLHNSLPGKEHVSIRWMGLDNFIRLLTQPDFWTFLGNTLFLMMGMPFGIAASLTAAILLSKDLRGGNGRIWAATIAGAALVASAAMLTVTGMGATAMTILLVGFAAMILVGGSLGGNTIYRTLFYIPSFVSGVATSILWKKLYAPETGPINAILSGPINALDQTVKSTPASLWLVLGWVLIAAMLGLFAWSMWRIRQLWNDGELGWAGATLTALLVVTPAALATRWLETPAGWTIGGAALLALLSIAVVSLILNARGMRGFVAQRWSGVGTGLMLGGAMLVAQFVLLGLGMTLWSLPERAAAENLHTPMWLMSINWSKPSLMIMGFWGAIGSNTMLLYLAALTNVPGELYEAADIDGASRFQKFWNVTWPQLAPTTFFVVVMGVIGGLQSGFETARVMTQGGPAGSTTTLAYFIYTEGFETGRLGYTSAVAWTLFLIVLVVTMFNWKFGNKYVND